jgi:hypothetical protein
MNSVTLTSITRGNDDQSPDVEPLLAELERFLESQEGKMLMASASGREVTILDVEQPVEGGLPESAKCTLRSPHFETDYSIPNGNPEVGDWDYFAPLSKVAWILWRFGKLAPETLAPYLREKLAS